MTTVYVPRVIRTAEDAEALPVGTVAHRVLTVKSVTDTYTQPDVAVKSGIDAWVSTAADEDAWDWLDRHLIGWTALVPVEARVEECSIETRGAPVPEWRRRYVTAWEDVPR